MKENELPALYEAADAASKRAQFHFFLSLGANLSCLVIAAVLSIINIHAAWFAIAQAALLLISLFLVIFLAYAQPQRIWYGTRALAESVKTVSWRYMMRAEPYETNDAEARAHFISGLKKIFESNQRISSHAVVMSGVDQITATMESIRNGSLRKRKEIYVEDRIEDQLIWYTRETKRNRCASVGWFCGMIAANALALIFSLIRIACPEKNHWPTDIFIAVASAAMAWFQTKRFQELSASYSLTTIEISLIKEAVPSVTDEQMFSIFVADAENAFSREHTQWQARKDT